MVELSIRKQPGFFLKFFGCFRMVILWNTYEELVLCIKAMSMKEILSTIGDKIFWQFTMLSCKIDSPQVKYNLTLNKTNFVIGLVLQVVQKLSASQNFKIR